MFSRPSPLHFVTPRWSPDLSTRKYIAQGSAKYCKVKYLCLNSWKSILLGKPCRQIRIPSSTPLHLSWSNTNCAAILPALTRERNVVIDQSVSWSVLSMQWYSALSVLTWSGLSLKYQQFTVNMAKNLTVYLLSSHGLE